MFNAMSYHGYKEKEGNIAAMQESTVQSMVQIRK
jgi:hypothetical protein